MPWRGSERGSTDPGDGLSSLRLSGYSVGGDVSFAWQAAPGASYTVQRSTSLGAWDALLRGIDGNGTLQFTEPAGQEDAVFHRVELEPVTSGAPVEP